jgi:hypothetical protein
MVDEGALVNLVKWRVPDKPELRRQNNETKSNCLD